MGNFRAVLKILDFCKIGFLGFWVLQNGVINISGFWFGLVGCWVGFRAVQKIFKFWVFGFLGFWVFAILYGYVAFFGI